MIDTHDTAPSPVSKTESPLPQVDLAEKLRRGRGRGRQMLKNLVSNFFSIFLQMILSMLLTRYLIHKLGPAQFGVVPLAFQIMTFFTLITMSINSSVGRYLTIEMAHNDLAGARRTFNSAFWGMMLVFTVLIPVAIGMAWYSPHFLNFAEGVEDASRRVLYATVYSFFVVTASSNIMVSSFARNRIDLQSYARIAWHTVRVGTPFVLIGWLGWGLDGVSVGIVLGATANLIYSIWAWRSLNPELKLKPEQYDKKRFLELANMSFWLMLDKIGRVLQFNASIIVVNMVLGAAEAGKYGAIMIFGRSLIMYNRSMRQVATPVIYSMYSHHKFDEMRTFLISFVRFEGVMLALPLGGFIVMAEPLLSVWLGPEYAHLALVVNWMMIGLILTMPMIPVRIIFAAKKYVKEPGILSMLTGIVNIGVSIWMVNPTWGLNMGLIAMPISALVTTQLKNFIYVPLKAAQLMKDKWYTYFLPLIRITIAYAFMLALAYGLRLWLKPDSWGELLLAAAIATAVYAPVGIFVFMTKEDREHVKELRRRRRGGAEGGNGDGEIQEPPIDIADGGFD